ncbi:hypothetical protein Pelo_13177 [Pelomyxa schiedti]|nr:hypothetical protein Pelo_16267 [Pelomyxa schiedti]KAH3745428.1 hypothetical protein Pelo_13177 [Pelomyxa schiedti]
MHNALLDDIVLCPSTTPNQFVQINRRSNSEPIFDQRAHASCSQPPPLIPSAFAGREFSTERISFTRKDPNPFNKRKGMSSGAHAPPQQPPSTTTSTSSSGSDGTTDQYDLTQGEAEAGEGGGDGGEGAGAAVLGGGGWQYRLNYGGGGGGGGGGGEEDGGGDSDDTEEQVTIVGDEGDQEEEYYGEESDMVQRIATGDIAYPYQTNGQFNFLPSTSEFAAESDSGFAEEACDDLNEQPNADDDQVNSETFGSEIVIGNDWKPDYTASKLVEGDRVLFGVPQYDTHSQTTLQAQNDAKWQKPLTMFPNMATAPPQERPQIPWNSSLWGEARTWGSPPDMKRPIPRDTLNAHEVLQARSTPESLQQTSFPIAMVSVEDLESDFTKATPPVQPQPPLHSSIQMQMLLQQLQQQHLNSLLTGPQKFFVQTLQDLEQTQDPEAQSNHVPTALSENAGSLSDQLQHQQHEQVETLEGKVEADYNTSASPARTLLGSPDKEHVAVKTILKNPEMSHSREQQKTSAQQSAQSPGKSVPVRFERGTPPGRGTPLHQRQVMVQPNWRMSVPPPPSPHSIGDMVYYRITHKFMSAEELSGILSNLSVQLCTTVLPFYPFLEEYYRICREIETKNETPDSVVSYYSHRPLFDCIPSPPVRIPSGTLGKLEPISKAPRLMLQLYKNYEIVERMGSMASSSKHSLLLQIENAYNHLLDLEDIARLKLLPYDHDDLDETTKHAKLERKNAEIGATLFGVLASNSNGKDTLFDMVCIGKGARLFKRSLKVLQPQYQFALATVYIRNLHLFCSLTQEFPERATLCEDVFHVLTKQVTCEQAVAAVYIFLQTHCTISQWAAILPAMELVLVEQLLRIGSKHISESLKANANNPEKLQELLTTEPFSVWLQYLQLTVDHVNQTLSLITPEMPELPPTLHKFITFLNSLITFYSTATPFQDDADHTPQQPTTPSQQPPTTTATTTAPQPLGNKQLN